MINFKLLSGLSIKVVWRTWESTDVEGAAETQRRFVSWTDAKSDAVLIDLDSDDVFAENGLDLVPFVVTQAVLALGGDGGESAALVHCTELQLQQRVTILVNTHLV